MKTVGEFKAVVVVFVVGDKCKDNAFSYTKKLVLDKSKDFDMCELTEFAWRELSTRPDNARFKIELDIDNHRWRPSLNQGEEWPDEQRINAIGQNGNDGLHYADSIKTLGEQVVNFDIGSDQVEMLSVNKLEFEAHKANTDTLFRLTKFLVDNNIGKIGECCVDVAIRELTKKPVFTQAMADAGELPPIGAEVSYPSGKGNFVIGCDTDGVCIVMEDGLYKK